MYFNFDLGVLGQRHCPVKQNQNILLETLEQDATVWEMETCSNIFGGRPDVNSVSSLMPCYSTVDPKPYRDMCLKDMRKVSIANIQLFYITIIRFQSNIIFM